MIVVSAFAYIKHVQAQQSKAFGGMIYYSISCTCGESSGLVIGPPSNGFYLYQPGSSKLYDYSQTRMGVWTLGFADYGGACTILIYEECIDFETDGTITMMGTSL